MKFVLGFFVLAYVIVFFNPKLVISYNGVPTNNFFARVLGALIISLILTLFIGLPIIGVISLFVQEDLWNLHLTEKEI